MQSKDSWLAAEAGRKFCQKTAFSDNSIFLFGIPSDINHGAVSQCRPYEYNLGYTSSLDVSHLTLILYKLSNSYRFLI